MNRDCHLIYETYDRDIYHDKTDGYKYGGGNVIRSGNKWVISKFHMDYHDKGKLKPGDKLKWVEGSKIWYGIILPVTFVADKLPNPWNRPETYFEIAPVDKNNSIAIKKINKVIDLGSI